MGVAAPSGVDAFLVPLPALPSLMKEPPSIKAEPIACSTVNGEDRGQLSFDGVRFQPRHLLDRV